MLPSNSAAPLCVDLDGTLIAGDTTWLALQALLRARPAAILPALWALRGGRAFFKDALFARVALAVDRLPFRADVLRFLRDERAAGRAILLITAAPGRVASPIADHLGLFERVMASDAAHNLKGAAKADALLRLFGKGGFDYMGNDAVDLPVWAVSRRAYVVSRDEWLLHAVRRVADVAAVFKDF